MFGRLEGRIAMTLVRLAHSAPPGIRGGIELRITQQELAGMVGAAPEKIVGGARLGDNLTRAMIEKGLNADAFDAFGSRRRQ